MQAAVLMSGAAKRDVAAGLNASVAIGWLATKWLACYCGGVDNEIQFHCVPLS